jgi:hypothetical protein
MDMTFIILKFVTIVLVRIYANKIVIVKHFNTRIGRMALALAYIDVLQRHNCKMEGFIPPSKDLPI